jgi:hypothetical protein
MLSAKQTGIDGPITCPCHGRLSGVVRSWSGAVAERSTWRIVAGVKSTADQGREINRASEAFPFTASMFPKLVEKIGHATVFYA